MFKKIILGVNLWLFLSLFGGCVFAQTFTNPLLPVGADPWSIYKDGHYYYTHTLQDSIVIWKTANLANLEKAERKTIFIPDSGKAYSKEIWAPEIHFLNNKWYVYFAADDGRNENHRMYVLENSSLNPIQGEWILKGQVADETNKWAIDGSVFYHNNQLYIVWAGWEGNVNFEQNIYIAKMKNPWTITGERVKISSPLFDWEKHGDLNNEGNPPHVDVNEGPQILKHKKKTFLIYSASGCWTDYYALGMLTLKQGKSIMKASSWVKSNKPVFKQSLQNQVFAPGHNSFFKSPDGSEDWILYHANPLPNLGCGQNRSPRAQKFTWNKNGTPNFGLPLPTQKKLLNPSNKKL